MADVYAADDAVPGLGATISTLFVIVIDADPDALLRVAMHLRLTNVAPAAGTILGRPDGALVLSFEMRGINRDTADLVRRKLLQLSTVHAVDTYCMFEPANCKT